MKVEKMGSFVKEKLMTRPHFFLYICCYGVPPSKERLYALPDDGYKCD